MPVATNSSAKETETKKERPIISQVRRGLSAYALKGTSITKKAIHRHDRDCQEYYYPDS